jgi:Arc/MetJ family transcription regulator
MQMASRSTEYRKRKGLMQVGLDWDAATWSQALELPGATTRRGPVEALLRRAAAARIGEQASKADSEQARAEASARCGEPDAL